MTLTRSTICLIKIFKQNVFSLFQLLERLTYFQSYNETLYKAISTNLEKFGYFRIPIFFHLFGAKMKSIGIYKM